jgi:hypothetical protein
MTVRGWGLLDYSSGRSFSEINYKFLHGQTSLTVTTILKVVNKQLYSNSLQNIINLAPDTFKEAVTANFVPKDFSNNDYNYILAVEYSVGMHSAVKRVTKVSLQPGYLRQTPSTSVPIAAPRTSHGLKVQLWKRNSEFRKVLN